MDEDRRGDIVSAAALECDEVDAGQVDR